MKKNLFVLIVIFICQKTISQSFSVEEFLSKDCRSENCLTGFLQNNGYSKPVLWKETYTYVSERGYSNSPGGKKIPNSLVVGFPGNYGLLILSTYSRSGYDEMLNEIKNLGFGGPESKMENGKNWNVYSANAYPKCTISASSEYDSKKEDNKFSYSIKIKWLFEMPKPVVPAAKEPASFESNSKAVIPKLSEDLVFFYYENWTKAKAGFKKSADKDATSAYWLIETMLADGSGKEEIKKELVALEKIFPGHSLIMVAKGHLFLFEGKTAEAKSVFEKAIAASGAQKADVLNAIGRAHGNVPLKFSEPDYGISKIKESLSLQSQNPFAYLNMGDCYRNRLDGGAAVGAYYNAMNSGAFVLALANYKTGKVYASQQNCDAFTKYFNESVKAEPNFMPGWRELFENYSDPSSSCYNPDKAKTYFEKYVSTSNPGNETDMLRASYAYRTKDYTTAIQIAKKLVTSMSSKAPARLYKLVGYSYFELRDYPSTIKWMEDYYLIEKSEEAIIPDNYRLLADAYNLTGQTEKAKTNYLKAAEKETDKVRKIRIIEKAAEMCISAKDYNNAALLYQQISGYKPNPSALDLFKTGTAYYNGRNYNSSKKIFETYSQKYPNDWIGFLWQARASAQIDSLMKTGEAAPLYEKYVSLGSSDAANKKSTVEAYLYLFATSYNIKKDKPQALSYLDKVLAIDPQNANALRYKEMLSK